MPIFSISREIEDEFYRPKGFDSVIVDNIVAIGGIFLSGTVSAPENKETTFRSMIRIENRP